MSALLKIVVVFVAMLVGIRYRLGVAWSILIGSVLLVLLFGHGPLFWVTNSTAALQDPKLLFLGAIVGLILLLSGLMEHTGQAGRFMEALAGRLRGPRLALIFFPSLIGLLPMPGGAIFSAPMLKEMAGRVWRGRPLTGEDLALINYWFRHVWEMAWPLYPGVILAAALAHISVFKLIAWCFPGMFVCFVLGWVFVLRPLFAAVKASEPTETALGVRTEATPDLASPESAPAKTDAAPRVGLGRLLWEGLPLVAAIVGAVGLEVVTTTLMPEITSEWGVLLALFLAALIAALQNRVPPREVLRQLFSRHLLNMLFLVVAVFMFKEALGRSGAVEGLADLVGGEGGGEIGLLGVAVVLPLVMGLIAGITVAYVGAAFPLLLGLVAQLGQDSNLMAYMMLGMYSGFAGVLASPLHLCFVLTCQYYQVDAAPVWRRLIWPAVLFQAFGMLYFVALRWFV